MPRYQWAYNGYESNVTEYGRLYTWYALIDSRGLCPEGYHVPADAEWTVLIENLGGDSIAGGKLKETGISHWSWPNLFATDSIGFKALPGGNRGNDGKFYNIENIGLWWSSTEKTDSTAWYRLMYAGNGMVERNPCLKYNAYSVRCIKD